MSGGGWGGMTNIWGRQIQEEDSSHGAEAVNFPREHSICHSSPIYASLLKMAHGVERPGDRNTMVSVGFRL